MPDHGLRPKASRQQEPRLPSQALTQGCISLLPYQLNNVKLHYLVVRNEALHSGEGVPGADCTAARTIGSYKSQAGREIILGSSSFSLGSHLQHTTAAVLRQSPPGRTLGLSRLRVWPGMYETDRRLDWEEFLQERATATLKRSITLLQLRVLRLPWEWSGLWPWVHRDPEEIDYVAATQSSSAPLGVVRALAVGSSHASPEGIRRPKWIHPKQIFFQPNSAAHTQLTPAVDTRCPADSNDVWTPEATGVIESMVQDTRALLAGCFQ